MIEHTEFCRQLRGHLQAHAEKVLLSIVVGPNFDQPLQLTGLSILEKVEKLTSFLALPRKRAVVLLLLPHSPELFLLHLGLVLKGYIPAILSWPTSRVDAEKYQRNLIHQLSNLPADLLITLPRLADNLTGCLPYLVTGHPVENSASFEKLFPVRSVSADLERYEFPRGDSQPSLDALFLQFSGGTTGAQKAIVVTATMLSEQLKRLGEKLEIGSTDSVVSWLPMYHDMGLIACFWLPLWHGAPSLQVAANDWVINPELLLKYIERSRATFCWLPNFSFSYLSQRREFMHSSYALGSMRAWINCSEPVRLKSLVEFGETFSEWGVRRDSLQASYAMAETVFAITQSEIGQKLATYPRSQVNHGGQSYNGLTFDLIDEVYASSGKPLPGTDIKIVSSHGSVCEEAVAGEIYVRTPSLFSGYWGTDGFQTHSLQDGWHATGDYGFLAGGELFVIGRFKDIVIVGGNNIFPEDVETVVNTINGIYPGRVVVFGLEDKDYGTQSLAIVAEMRGDFEEGAAVELEATIRKLVLTTIGTAPRHVTVVPERWIVKSTAGKISRRETRERFLRHRLLAGDN